MAAIEAILIPTDFSTTGEFAVEYGCSLAQTLKSRVHLLHVVENPHLGPGGATLWNYSLPALRERLEEEAEERMATLAAQYEPDLVVERDARVGEPWVEIVDCARERRVDLIVMGTHGHGAVAQLLLGSVAERVVQHSPCPVLTVRPTEHDTPSPP